MNMKDIMKQIVGKNERERERGNEYLTRTLDSAHLFKN